MKQDLDPTYLYSNTLPKGLHKPVELEMCFLDN